MTNIGKDNMDDTQRAAYEAARAGDNLFITGGAGVGKSEVAKAIIRWCRENDKNIVIAAPARSAVELLDSEGVTIHKAFNSNGLRMDISDETYIDRLANSLVASADVLLIDEISLCSDEMFGTIIRNIRWIQYNIKRKIQLIIVGDFLQLPPVSPWETPVGFAFESRYWKTCSLVPFVLKKVYRQDNAEFVNVLNCIRERKNLDYCVRYINSNANVYTTKLDVPFICARNDKVDEINTQEMDKLPGEYKYFMASGVEKAFKKTTFRKQLKLKQGAFVVTLYNHPDGSYYNGMLGIVEKICEDAIYVRVIGAEKVVEVRRVTIDVELSKSSIVRVTQFPIMAAYAMTVHKSQGKSLGAINLDPFCFADGQLYVGLSRVDDVKNLYLTRAISKKDIMVNEKVVGFYEELERYGMPDTA